MSRVLVAVAGVMLIAGLLSACEGSANAATLAAPPAAPVIVAPIAPAAPAVAPQPAPAPMSIDKYVRAGLTQGQVQTQTVIQAPQVQQPVVQPAVTPAPVDQTKDGTTGGEVITIVTPAPADQSQSGPSIYLPPGYVPPVYQPVFQPPVYSPPVYQPPPQPVAVDIPPVLGVHLVQPGETLFCIGRAYEVDPNAIATANLLSPYAFVQPGDLLMIPATRWANMPAGTACPAQFDPEWSYFNESAAAAPVCGNAVFGAPTMTTQPFGAAGDQQYVQAAGSFGNGYGETFVITVTGRRYEAVNAFVFDLPAVCFGGTRYRPTESTEETPVPLAAASAVQTAGLGPYSVLADPATFNLVIELAVSTVSGREYDARSAFSFVIDPELYGGVTHYFRTQANRGSALAVIGATSGGVSGTLYRDCVGQTPQPSNAGSWPAVLTSNGLANYALTVSGVMGISRYNVAGTWGDLDMQAGGSVCR